MLLNTHFNLKTIFKSLAFVLPNMMFNPFGPNKVYVPIDIKPHSTYINYKLELDQVNIINSYIKSYNDSLSIVPIQLYDDYVADYYLSINIYNCSSPIFNFISEDPVTRCELNVYVVNKNNEQGTMILDYASNILSLDPDNIFKRAGNATFCIMNNTTSGNVNSDDFTLNFDYNNCNSILYNKKLSDNLVDLCDKIYYPNGYYDKLYFDSSLLNNDIIKCNNYNVYFKFLDIEFSELDIDSIFYFTDKINFVGGMWENIFTKV